MSTIELCRLTKVFGKHRDITRAVDGLSLRVEAGEIMVLVGPSGCGKTTSLRLIAGLEPPTDGTIILGGKDVTSWSPQTRNIAMVFQNYALYPHMSVFENMAFGLKVRGCPKGEIESRVLRTAKMLGVEQLLHRRPQALSGGQLQRVAVGRAVVRQPAAFLLDEPLSNLDARNRLEMRAELKALLKKLGATVLYVTHDQEEAMSVGDRLTVMHGGKAIQTGTPQRLYHSPVNRFVAGFVGSPRMNFFPAKLAAENGQEYVALCDTVLPLPSGCAGMAGADVVVGIRPQALRFEAAGGKRSIKVKVDLVEPLGSVQDVHGITAGGEAVIARVQGSQRIRAGETAELYFDGGEALIFEPGAFGRNLMGPRNGKDL